jgi:hypothetical protein
VEDVFPSNPSEMLNMFVSDEHHRGSVNGKAWVNQTLENNPVPTIWISNSINQIDPAYLRRFQFHLELKNPPQNVRANITKKHLTGMDVSAEFVEKLSARRTLTPAQIHAAARFAQLTHGKVEGEIDATVEALMLKQLDRSDEALGHKEEADKSQYRPLVTTYDLSLLNIETRHPIEKIVNALKNKGAGSLCFFGRHGVGACARSEWDDELDGTIRVLRESNGGKHDRKEDGEQAHRGGVCEKVRINRNCAAIVSTLSTKAPTLTLQWRLMPCGHCDRGWVQALRAWGKSNV